MNSARGDRQLIKLIMDSQFTPELFLHYLYRKYNSVDILDNLIVRLYNFSDYQISRILIYIM